MPNVSSENMITIIPPGQSQNSRHQDDKSNSASANKMANAGKAAEAGKETAAMTLRGYPRLRAKATVEVTGVGKGSGKWYCKTVVQQWHVDHGYITNAQLTKGGGDSGRPGGDTPIDKPVK